MYTEKEMFKVLDSMILEEMNYVVECFDRCNFNSAYEHLEKSIVLVRAAYRLNIIDKEFDVIYDMLCDTKTNIFHEEDKFIAERLEKKHKTILPDLSNFDSQFTAAENAYLYPINH